MTIAKINLLVIPALTFFACNATTQFQLAMNCVLILGNVASVWSALEKNT